MSSPGTPPPELSHRLDFALPPAVQVSKRRLLTLGLAAFVAVAAAFAFGYLRHRREHTALGEAAGIAQHALPRVEVIAPKIGARDRALTLPGSVQALQETVLFARASGYVRAWHADIGDKVKNGQLLAELATPELDQELAQAEAQLQQLQASLALTRASRKLADSNLSRSAQLAPSGVVSEAELEQSQAQAQVGEANVDLAAANFAAQQASIRRLRQLKAFALVTAPFAGTITRRTVEIGALVTAGNGQPLFRIAAMDPARVFVQVPQDVAPSVRPGVPGSVTVREYPGRTFLGEVTRAAGELDPETRTMNTEIRVPNKEGALFPGMYAEVALLLPSPHRVLEVPATTLLNDSRGQRMAIVDGQGKLHLVPVVVERDNGASLEISSGLQGNEQVVKIGSAAFVEGMAVEVAAPASSLPAPAK